jgi:hypothetical protein
MDISVTINGVQALSRKVTGIKHRAENMAPVLRVISRDFRRIMVLQFDTRGSYLGTDWAPLAASTIERKERAGVDQRILHWSRALRFSLTTGQEGINITTEDSLELGTAIEYAGFVSDGTRNQPARELFKMNKVTSRRWNRAMRLYLMHGVLEMEAL